MCVHPKSAGPNRAADFKGKEYSTKVQSRHMMENHVAKLNELTQRRGFGLRYEDLGSVGPAHDKM